MKRLIGIWLVLLLTLTAASSMAQDVIEMRHTHYNLNVRAGPGLGYSIIGSIDSCDWLHVVREVDRWYQVRYDEGSGFVAGWYTAVGNPHCANQPEQNIPGSSGGASAPVEAAETPEPAPGDLSNFTDNMCFRGWDCGDGSTPESQFMWRTGWCAATIQLGGAQWSLEQCQIGLGLLPGDPSAGVSVSSGSSGSDDSGDSDDTDSNDGTVVCPPGQAPLNPAYGDGCGDA